MLVSVDTIDNIIDELYSGPPELLYLIDREGIIRFKSDEGLSDGSNIDRWIETIDEVMK